MLTLIRSKGLNYKIVDALLLTENTHIGHAYDTFTLSCTLISKIY